MLFRITYILFLVSSITLGSIYIGSFSCRQLLTIVMLICCLKESKGVWTDKCINYLFLFSVFFGITSFYYGHFSEFFKFFVGYYVVAWIAMWSTTITFKRNNSNDCVNTLVCIGLFDSVITILQSVGNEMALALGFVFAPEEAETLMDSVVQGELINNSIMGIFGAVSNGYYLLVASILSLIYVIKGRNVFRYLPFMLCFVASFMCQQRSPFFINILFTTFFIFKSQHHLTPIKKIIRSLIVVLVCAFFVSAFVDFAEHNNMRYFSLAMDDDGREDIYTNCREYLKDNILFANIFEYRRLYQYSPHNLLYNMLIYGGIFGFVPIFVALWIQVKTSLQAVWLFSIRENIVKFVSAGALLAFTANSLLHNASIITGDVLLWVLWGAVISLMRNRI